MRRWRTSGEDGFTLIELLIAMGLITIVLAAIGTVFTGTLRASRVATARTSLTADESVVLEAISRDLRVAVAPAGQTSAITAASQSGVTFYANITGSAPTQIQFGVDTTKKCIFRTTGAGTSCLAFGTVPATGLFTYYGSGTSATPLAFDASGALPAGNFPSIKSIAVRLALGDTSGSGAQPVQVSDRVYLSNVGGF